MNKLLFVTIIASIFALSFAAEYIVDAGSSVADCSATVLTCNAIASAA